MTPDPEKRRRACDALDLFIDSTLDGLLANVDAIEGNPRDAKVGQRIRAHLIDLERLVSIRNGLAVP